MTAGSFVANPGAGGATFAGDLVAGENIPYSKLAVGGTGALVEVSAANPMPAVDAAGNTILAAIQTLLTTLNGTVGLADSPWVPGSAGQVILAKRRDSDTTTVADGDLNSLNMDEEGRLKVATKPASYASTTASVTSATSTVPINATRFSNLMIHCAGTFAGVNCTFEGSLNSTNGTDGSWFAVQAIRTNANTIETTTGVLAAAPAYAWELSVNALTWFRIRATAWTSGTQVWTLVPGTYATEPIPGAQVSGTQPVSGTGLGVVGAAAHDAAVSGNPVRLAGRALTANYTAVATGDTADLVTTLVGAVIQKPYAIPEADWTYAAATGGIINTTDVAVKAAAAAGIRNYVTSVNLSNNSATATEFVIKDGATTVLWRCHLPANCPNFQVDFATPLRGTAATAVNVACITTAAAVYCNVQGYIAP